MPGPQIQNSAGAFGASALPGYTGDDLSPLVTEMRAAVSTIVRGDIVALSTSSGYCIRCLTDTGQQLMVGIALAPQTTIGNPVPIVVYGPFIGANKDNTVAVTAANLVTRSAAVTATLLALAGSTAITQLKDTGLTIGIVQANAIATATTCDIFVCKI